jgi:hypothetical protein
MKRVQPKKSKRLVISRDEAILARDAAYYERLLDRRGLEHARAAVANHALSAVTWFRDNCGPELAYILFQRMLDKLVEEVAADSIVTSEDDPQP